MAIYSIGVRTTNLTITQACLELRTPGTAVPKLLEMSIVQAAATAQSLGLGRPQAIGITPGGTAILQSEDPPASVPASTVTSALSWATSPTVPLIFHRRWNSAAVIGVGVVWVFPRGLGIPISFSLVVWNITAAQASDCCVVMDE